MEGLMGLRLQRSDLKEGKEVLSKIDGWIGRIGRMAKEGTGSCR